MSEEDLLALKEKHKDNATITTMVDGYLKEREQVVIQLKATKDFEKGIAELFAKLPHPEAIHNVYAGWGEVEVPDKSKAKEDVTITDTEAVTDKDGKITAQAKTHTEKRYPTMKVFKWVVETNKGFTVKSGGNGQPTTSKRAITVYKRNGTQLESKGNFQSATKACEHLKLEIGGDSASRVLARDNFITEPYDGTDYTTS